MRIWDYNRVVFDLNGLSEEQFIAAVKSAGFELIKAERRKPSRKGQFMMYLNKTWYEMNYTGLPLGDDPVSRLDVSVLSDKVLAAVLGITDLRNDERIDFIGGIRGLGELKRRVDSGEMKMALALYPVSMKQLMDIADTGNIMPPKTTWFEPKLRSGLFIHEI